MSANDREKRYGPLPAGKYLADMISVAARTVDTGVPVIIERNKIEKIDFVFEADGELRGFVSAPLKPENRYAGMPEVVYQQDNENLRVQSITLTGNGIRRTLKPIQQKNMNDWEQLILSRSDFCHQKRFGFFGLPAGNYTLSIKAEGYKLYEKKYSVIPGIPNKFSVTYLTPD